VTTIKVVPPPNDKDKKVFVYRRERISLIVRKAIQLDVKSITAKTVKITQALPDSNIKAKK
jgi:hypothetical protein